MTTKKYVYEGLGPDELSAVAVIKQSVTLMDLAAKMATDQGDIDRMAKLSMKMLSIGATLAEILEEEEEEPEEVVKIDKRGYGFAQDFKSANEVEVEEGDDE